MPSLRPCRMRRPSPACHCICQACQVAPSWLLQLQSNLPQISLPERNTSNHQQVVFTPTYKEIMTKLVCCRKLGEPVSYSTSLLSLSSLHMSKALEPTTRYPFWCEHILHRNFPMLFLVSPPSHRLSAMKHLIIAIALMIPRDRRCTDDAGRTSLTTEAQKFEKCRENLIFKNTCET